MRKRATVSGHQPPRMGCVTPAMMPRVGTRGRRRRTGPPRGLVALVMSGLLLGLGAFLGQVVPWREARSPGPQVEPPPPVIVVQEDPLPPVLQRIAQCKVGGSSGRAMGRCSGVNAIRRILVSFKSMPSSGPASRGTRLRSAHAGRQHADGTLYVCALRLAPWQASAKCWSRVRNGRPGFVVLCVRASFIAGCAASDPCAVCGAVWPQRAQERWRHQGAHGWERPRDTS